MGTSKNVLLASLVSLMIVLAFFVGLAPWHGTEDTTAAAPDDQVDMADLLDMVLGVKQVGGDITLETGPPVTTIKTTSDPSTVPLLVDADLSIGAEDAEVVLVANDENEDAFDAENSIWTGMIHSEGLAAPYEATLDLAPLLEGQMVLASNVAINALVRSTSLTKQAESIYYESRSQDPIEINLVEQPFVDEDGNTLPDNLMDITANQMWYTTEDGTNVQTAVVNLSAAMLAKQVLDAEGVYDELSVVNGNTTITAPTLTSLVDAGLVAETENAWLIVKTADNLADIVDSVGGEDSETARTGWADDAEAAAPGPKIENAPWTEISIVYTTDGGEAIGEIESLEGTGLLVTVRMSDLNILSEEATQLWSYPTMISLDGSDSTIITDDAEAEAGWTLIANRAATSETDVVAQTQKLSVFAPFASGIDLESVSPARIPVGQTAEATLMGVFPTIAALNAADAAANYTVYVRPAADAPDPFTMQADFREVGGVAITEWTGEGQNEAYITIPSFDEAGFLDVRVVDTNNPNNLDTVFSAVEVVETATLDVSASGNVEPVEFETDPEGPYLAGDSVSVTAMFDETVDMLVEWTLNGEPISGVGGVVAFTLDAGENTLVANFEQEQVETFSVTTQVQGNAQAMIQLSPDSSPNQPTGVYEAGTEVQATVSVPSGANFAGWTINGENVGTANPLTFTVDQDIELVAHFGQIVDTFQVMVDVSGSGTVSVEPVDPSVDLDPNNIYPAGTTVRLVAQPFAGNVFEGWTGPDAEDLQPDTESGTVTVVLTEDINVTANFGPIPDVALTGLSGTGANVVDGKPWVWLFGGVAVQVNGVGLTNGAQVTIDPDEAVAGDEETAQLYNANAGGTEALFVAPPLDIDGLDPWYDVDVIVTGQGQNNEDTLEDALRYYRFRSETGVSTTALVLDAGQVAEAEIAVGPTFSGDDLGMLRVPVLDAEANTPAVYGIARVTDAILADAKQNTQELPAGEVIPANVALAGQQVAGARDWSLHLYQDMGANTQPMLNTPIYGVNDGLIDVPTANADNTTNEDTFRWTFAVPGSPEFTIGDVRCGVSIFGVDTTYNYATLATTADADPAVAYQSVLLDDEVVPTVEPSVAADAQVTGLDGARIYSMNAFSLRTSVPMPDDVAQAILAANPGGLSGEEGTEISIVSPQGYLAYVTRVEFVNEQGEVIGTVVQDDFVTEPGTTETMLVFDAPAPDEAGQTDLRLFLCADDANPAVTLPSFFEFEAAPAPPRGPGLLLILGIILALLGLAAGGDSGGDGGGPCFIATAAYGTPLAGEIDTLRAVRDTYLLDNVAGTALVDTYYRVSPAIADAVAAHPALAALVRLALVPVIFIGKAALAMPALTWYVALALGFAFMMLRRRGRAKAQA